MRIFRHRFKHQPSVCTNAVTMCSACRKLCDAAHRLCVPDWLLVREPTRHHVLLYIDRRSRMESKRMLKYIAALSIGALALTACGGGGDGGGGDNEGGGSADGEMVINAHGTEPQNPLVPTNTNEVG